jgi:HTH-type transcriptional regulator/antitoxin HigA
VGEEHRIPGQLIEELLSKHGWTKRVLAVVLDVDESVLSKIIAGKRSLDAKLALELSEVFAVPAEEFLRLQQAYDLAQARLIAKPNPKRAMRAQIFGGLPVAEMVKRGWIAVENVRNLEEVEAALIKFFKTNTIEEITEPAHAAKKTDVGKDSTLVQIAWLHRVREIAEEMLVPRFSPDALRNAIGALKRLLSAAEEARHVPRILMEAGVRFMLVESLPSAKIDGVCTWLNDSSPVVALSARHDRIDNFWFVLRHELEHVLREHGKTATVVDVDLDRLPEGDIPEDERVANEAAADFCVSQASLQAFIARKAPYFAERDIIGFARTNQIHPGLVAGQLQHKTKRYDRFRTHQVKIRSIVAPSATVDGWGDVAPVGL